MPAGQREYSTITPEDFALLSSPLNNTVLQFLRPYNYNISFAPHDELSARRICFTSSIHQTIRLDLHHPHAAVSAKIKVFPTHFWFHAVETHHWLYVHGQHVNPYNAERRLNPGRVVYARFYHLFVF